MKKHSFERGFIYGLTIGITIAGITTFVPELFVMVLPLLMGWVIIFIEWWETI